MLCGAVRIVSAAAIIIGLALAGTGLYQKS